MKSCAIYVLSLIILVCFLPANAAAFFQHLPLSGQIASSFSEACPDLGKPSGSLSVCSGASGNLSAQVSTGNINVRFVLFSAPQTGSDAYTGGTPLGTVNAAAFTGSGPFTATLGNALLPSAPGTYYVYAILDTDDPDLTDVSCRPQAEIVVKVLSKTPLAFACNDNIVVSLDEDGVVAITPAAAIEGTVPDLDRFEVSVSKSGGVALGDKVTCAEVGDNTVKFRLLDRCTGVECWGIVTVEDKLAPKIDCKDLILSCGLTRYDPDYLKNTLKLAYARPVVTENCGTPDVGYLDTWVDLPCTLYKGQYDYSGYILRKWTAEDAHGNLATCEQYLYFARKHIDDVKFPRDTTLDCSNYNEDPAVTGVPYIEALGLKLDLYPNNTICEINAFYSDNPIEVCDGTTKILREWVVYDWCKESGLTNPRYHTQLIKFVDQRGPDIACPAGLTVSADAQACCATLSLPDVRIDDNCSRIDTLHAMLVAGINPQTGEPGAMYTLGGKLKDFPGNNLWKPDTLGTFTGSVGCLPTGVYQVRYTASDNCGNTTTCNFSLSVVDQTPPFPICHELTQVALGADGAALADAEVFNNGSYDNCAPLRFKARRMNANTCQPVDKFLDRVRFCCTDIGDTVNVILRMYSTAVPTGPLSLDTLNAFANECMVRVLVEDKIRPVCIAPKDVTVNCDAFDPTLWSYGLPKVEDNCCPDTILTKVDRSKFDTLCKRGTIVRNFQAFDCNGLSNTCSQRVVVTYSSDYAIRFPDDRVVNSCNASAPLGRPSFFGEDCELFTFSYDQNTFELAEEACFKIVRKWKIVNWCLYDPQKPCIEVPNPEPIEMINSPTNFRAPIISRKNTPIPWTPTVTVIYPGGPTVDYSDFYDSLANCYEYNQVIKVIDNEPPVLDCPKDPVFCDETVNDTLYWNDYYWLDKLTDRKDLCEGPTDLTISGIDSCAGDQLDFRYILLLDMDQDGVMETAVDSYNPPPPGYVMFGNAVNADYSGGEPRIFDVEEFLQFGLEIKSDSLASTGSVRWTITDPSSGEVTYVVPELPYGTHKIKWFVRDKCGGEARCEYVFTVKDCKKPTVVCNNRGINLPSGGKVTLWASDFLEYGEDNCTPAEKLVFSVSKDSLNTFPVDANGAPLTNVTFDCTEQGIRLVRLWAKDKAGNADFCENYLSVQDNMGHCPNQKATVAGALVTETQDGLSESDVVLEGTHPALPPISMFDFTDNQGRYDFSQAVPLLSTYTITPQKLDNPLNGVTTYDLVLISKHILGLEPLSSPLKMIAADVNNTGSITAADIVELRRLILGIYTYFPANTSWRFVDKSYVFPDQANPFSSLFPEKKNVSNLNLNRVNEDFYAIKIGDVNLTATSNNLMSVEDRTAGTLLFDVEDRVVNAGETFEVAVQSADKVQGYQFTLLHPGLELTDIAPGAHMGDEHFAVFSKEQFFTTSWSAPQTPESASFTLRFRALSGGKLSDLLRLSSRVTPAEAYLTDEGSEKQAVALRFKSPDGATDITGVGFEVYQNQPNPFVEKTAVGFHLPEPADAVLTVYDETGRAVLRRQGHFEKGMNRFVLERSALPTGALFYRVETSAGRAGKMMIRTR
jgi:hypothetical protein